ARECPDAAEAFYLAAIHSEQITELPERNALESGFGAALNNLLGHLAEAVGVSVFEYGPEARVRSRLCCGAYVRHVDQRILYSGNRELRLFAGKLGSDDRNGKSEFGIPRGRASLAVAFEM